MRFQGAFGRSTRRFWLVAAILSAGGAAGCSLFGPDRPKPKPLEPIAAPIAVAQVWRQNLGAVQFPMTMAVNDGVVTLAASDGNVMALTAATGEVLWRGNAGGKLSAGVGSDGKTAAVVTGEGVLVAMARGAVKWKVPLGTRVATAPLVAGERVFVLSVDRAVQAFDAGNGAKLWQAQTRGDPLTLAQTGVITAFRNVLVVGQGPRMAGLDPLDGSVRWDVTIGSPRGANEVERLADLVGPAVRAGDKLCARSFQAAVGCVDAAAGRAVWIKNVGGTDAVAGTAERLFGADASDRITAWSTANGDVAWESESLMFRDLGAPAVIGGAVVFGDRDGMLHWLSPSNGQAQLRLPTDGSAIRVPPVVAGGVLIVATRAGGVFAFRPGVP